jgi:menaquinone-dependent protoporphyrinogen oxidase
MSAVGIFYATREGHTRRIAEHLAAVLRSSGIAVDVLNVKEVPAEVPLTRYDAVVLAASVHAGSHEPEMIAFVKSRLPELDRVQHAFLSVTLSEAGAERQTSSPEERARFSADVQKVIDAFVAETGWHPQRVKPVAGALLYTQYNFLVRFIMKQIAKSAHADTDTSKDFDYTDWDDLARFAEKLAAELRH